jgi:hypothetical protein
MDEFNPYESPRADCRMPAEAQREFPARLAPRDLIDAAIGLPLGILVGGILSGLGAATFYALGWDPLWGVLAFISPVLLVLPIGLKRVKLGDLGLEVERYGGLSYRVRWEDVRGARLASRGEILWVSLTSPYRVCTWCLAYRDHCRVDYAGGHFYFPPREPAVFLANLERERSAASADDSYQQWPAE